MLHSFVVTKMYSIKLQKQAERQTELKRMGNMLWLKLRFIPGGYLGYGVGVGIQGL